MYNKTYLLCRMGGVGDCVALTPIAKELTRQGYKVHFACGSPTGNVAKLFDNLDIFDKILSSIRIREVDCIRSHEGNWVAVESIKPQYYKVIDYKNSVELNSLYGGLAGRKGYEWIVSQNSNYWNWVDLSFAWAKIDPIKIVDEDKRPIYKIEKNEVDWAKKVIPERLARLTPEFVIGINLTASSLCRTWYHPEDLPALIFKKYPTATLLIFSENQWQIRKKEGAAVLILPPKDIDPLRASAALINEMDCYISADSGFSHLAEAVGVNTIVPYFTVPAWTRMKYYKHCYPLEPRGIDCFPCFTLDRFCARSREIAEKSLNQRQKKIKELNDKKVHINEASKIMNTNPQGLDAEFQALQRQIEALYSLEPPCVKAVTNEILMDKLVEVIG